MEKRIVSSVMALMLCLQINMAWAQEPSVNPSPAPAKRHKPRVGDIQDDEIESINRRVKSRRFTSIGFGPYGSSTSTEGGVMYGLTYGWTFEASETGEIRFDMLATASSVSGFFDAEVGYGYMPLTGNVSPILGAQLGGGVAKYKQGDDSETASGFAGRVFAGVRFFRTADAQMEILANYHAVFDKAVPGVYGLQLRVLY